MENKWEKGLEIMQSRKRWEFYWEGLTPSLPCDPIRFYAKSQEMAIKHACDILVTDSYKGKGNFEAALLQRDSHGVTAEIHMIAFDNICVEVVACRWEEEDDDDFYMMWNGKTWEREEIGEDIDIDWTKSVFWPKGEKKQSDFYPNADENGMVDVSDYPYTK